MATRRQSEDVIQRQGILRYIARQERDLNRKFKSAEGADGRWAIRGRLHSLLLLRDWLKKQATRARKPGGIGRR